MNTQFPLLPTGGSTVDAEVIAARGSRATLNDRISVISNFASPNAGGVTPGVYYDNSFHAATGTTLIGVANRAVLAPYFPSRSFSIDQIGVAVSTAVAGSLLRCFIYGSNGVGWPDQLLFEGAGDLSGAVIAYVSHAVNFTFQSGTQYWLGARWSSTTTVRAVPTSSAVTLGVQSAVSTSYNTVIQRTIPFTTALPQSWGFQPSELFSSAPPSIRFRGA